jgi:hypothetical protein
VASRADGEALVAAAADAVAKQYADMITMPVFGVVFDA